MKIFTSYFDNLFNIGELVPIGIAGISLPGFKGLEYKRFIYDNYIQSGDEENYSKDYYQFVLDRLNPEQVIKELNNLSGGKDVVLLCYEKPYKFCHRHLVAKWFKTELNIEVEEL